jgi:ADP-dependent NAD(P)H-hydrate dehydratase
VSDGPVVVSPALLAQHPLPDPGEASDKGERGDVLVVGGTVATPGAVLLAGIAALRAGAGRLQVATVAEHRSALALALPEAGVLDAGDVASIAEAAAQADAVLVGPGTTDPDPVRAVVEAVVEAVGDGDGRLVLDAGALPVVAERPALVADLGDRALLVPNPSEIAAMLGDDGPDADDDPAACLAAAIDRFGCAVAVRGGETWMAVPGGAAHVDRSGCVGLATSGSGDVLAGLAVGFAARGADATTALLWAVHAHARAGRRSAACHGQVGFLARELLDELPPALQELTG